MEATDVQRLFAPFGEIALVDVAWNPVTQLNQGYAVVKFTTPQDAANAIKGMDGYLVNGVPLKVSQLTPYMTMGTRPSQLGGDQGFVQKYTTAVKPAEIIEKPTSKYALPIVDKSTQKIIQTIIEKVGANKHYVDEPTRTVAFFNLFDFEDRRLTVDRDFLKNLIDDVEGAIISRVQKVWVDRANPAGKRRVFRTVLEVRRSPRGQKGL
jgi:RNA recognition motif-containing protein